MVKTGVERMAYQSVPNGQDIDLFMSDKFSQSLLGVFK